MAYTTGQFHLIYDVFSETRYLEPGISMELELELELELPSKPLHFVLSRKRVCCEPA